MDSAKKDVKKDNPSMRKTGIDMSGLLQILGENLYSTPSVAVRELIQNAHDACHRRKIEQTDVHFDAEIMVSTQSQENKLIIEDNGSGLTREEIINFLATIGTGYTRKLRNDEDSRIKSNVQDQLVGYFGLGFLSAYVVAEKVEMYTCSYQKPHECWFFLSKGGEQYLLEQCDDNMGVGTRLVLTLKPEFKELATLAVVEDLVKKYCCLLSVPIINKNTQRIINHLQPPWRLADTLHCAQLKQHQLAFAQLFEPNFEPICTLPIELPETDGLFWIQDAGFYATNDNRKVSVFIRNMFIGGEMKTLLPAWAGFVGCVVNTKCLTPTASREDIQKDSQFDTLKAYISEQLIIGLLHIADNEPEHWRRILLRHNSALLGASVSDERLMAVLKNKLTLPTTLGDMVLSEILKKSDGKLYIRRENKHGYEDALFRARQIPVVQGWIFAVPRFCDMAVPNQQIELGNTNSLDKVFSPVTTLDAEKIEKLKLWFEDDNEQIKIVHFEPEFIPLIYTEDQEVLLKRRMESDEMDKKMGMTALKLVRMHTNTIEDKAVRQVQINLNNKLINKLLNYDDEKNAYNAAVLLKSYMKALCIDPRGNLDLETVTQNFTDTIQSLI